MSKIILIIVMIISSTISYAQETIKEEPYFQDSYEKYIITANIGIQSSLRVGDRS